MSVRLANVLKEPCIWRDVLRDILDVTPIPRLRKALPLMSQKELTRACIVAYRLDKLVFCPKSYSRLSLDIDYSHSYSDIELIGVLPGGECFITLDDTRAEDVTMSLRSIHSPGISQKITAISTCSDALELLAVHCVSASVFRLVTFALAGNQ